MRKKTDDKKQTKKQEFLFLFTFICPCCTMAESSEYNLFYFELRMQYMWPIAGGYFVNVDFVVLGHPSNKRKGDSYPFGGTNTAINFLLLFVTCLLKLLIQSVHLAKVKKIIGRI